VSGSFNLFVYGTLKSGERNAHLLSGCELIGPGRVGGILYDIDGEHPALVVYGTTQVSGEVWNCSADLLLRLDEFEGLSTGLFRRIGVTVDTRNGPLPCWTYVAGPSLSHKLIPGRRIAAWTQKGSAPA
jgi:gamma-glutamylcyclotransferase (GGCT)/AIG2-like uncharacterized protein YtfP